MKETLPWASGKRKPAPGGKRKPRRWPRIRSRRHGVLAAVWGCISLLMLTAALFTQALLYFVVAGLGLLITVLALVAANAADDTVPTPARTAPRSVNPRGNTDPSRSTRQPGTISIRCTKTGQSIDDCGCAEKHVRTSDGSKYFKQPIGAPLARSRPGKPGKVRMRKKPAEPKVPMTKNAKPNRPPVGEVMRRIS